MVVSTNCGYQIEIKNSDAGLEDYYIPIKKKKTKKTEKKSNGEKTLR